MIKSLFINLISVLSFPYFRGKRKQIKGKDLVLLVGMHRSGSSALMGVLRILGLNIGQHLIPPMPENPKGFFEDIHFVRLNNEILKYNNTAWYLTADPEKIKRLNILLKIRLFNQIVKNLIKDKHFGIKDPRLSVLAPVYVNMCDRLGLKLKVIVIHRDKQSVVNSLLKRNHPPNISRKEYENLFEYYYSSIEKHFENHIIGEIEFKELISDPVKALHATIARFNYLHDVSSKEEDVNKFLEKDLLHNK